MNIIKLLVIILVGAAILSCNNSQKETGKFVVSGKSKMLRMVKFTLNNCISVRRTPKFLIQPKLHPAVSSA